MRHIRAITLDLDDTLWPSTPALVRAEQRVHAWLAANAPPVAAHWPIEQLRELRMSFYRAHPEWHYNLLHVRRVAMHAAFERAGVTGSTADALIEQSLVVFMAARNDVDLYPDVRDSLERLSRRYALAALTNGNADVAVIGIGHFFKARIAPHTHRAAKPDTAIFHMACRELGCAPGEVLHVGDDADLDVRGARAAGMPVLWINRNGAAWKGDDTPEAVTNLLELEQRLAHG